MNMIDIKHIPAGYAHGYVPVGMQPIEGSDLDMLYQDVKHVAETVTTWAKKDGYGRNKRKNRLRRLSFNQRFQD